MTESEGLLPEALVKRYAESDQDGLRQRAARAADGTETLEDIILDMRTPPLDWPDAMSGASVLRAVNGCAARIEAAMKRRDAANPPARVAFFAGFTLGATWGFAFAVEPAGPPITVEKGVTPGVSWLTPNIGPTADFCDMVWADWFERWQTSHVEPEDDDVRTRDKDQWHLHRGAVAMTPKSEPTMSEYRALQRAAEKLRCTACTGPQSARSWDDRCAAAVLQSLRERLERERVFVGAAKAVCERHQASSGLNFAGVERVRALLDAYRALTAPPEQET